MVLIIIILLLVLGIAFFQVVQGLFSAMVMTVLTILCAAIAFNFYEPLAQSLLYARHPAYANGVALMTLFWVPLLVLRFVFDRYLGGNVVLGVWADRIGGGALGLVTGLVAAGVPAVGLQMLPFGPSTLTYRPYDDTLQREQRLWPFRPDEFTLGLVDTLSGGSLSGTRTYSSAHDDLLLELWCAHNQIYQEYIDPDRVRHMVYVGRLSAPVGSLSVAGVYAPDPNEEGWVDGVPKSPLLSEQENIASKVYVVRTKVSQDARDGDIGWWRLPATQFRLVSDRDRSYYPVAYLTYREKPDRAEYQQAKDYMAYRSALPGGEWKLALPIADKQGDRPAARLAVCRKWFREGGPPELTIDWVYRLRAVEKPSADEKPFEKPARMYLRLTAGDEAPEPQDGMPNPADALARQVEQQR